MKVGAFPRAPPNIDSKEHHMAAEDRDLHRDPITDEPGAHPLGTGVGATGGAVAGAAAGTIGGPVGTIVGGVIGAVVGGLAGKAAAEAVNPTAEEAHWREQYTREPYYEPGRSFDDYGPAYMHGVRGRISDESDWDVAEPRLASEWANARAGSGLNWEQARPASRAAWDRVNRQRGAASGLGLAGAGLASDTAAMRAADLGAGGTDRGDTKDVIDTLQDLVECCKDGEYGFRTCAEQAQRADLKSLLLQRADDCVRAAEALNNEIRGLGGKAEHGGTAAGALHRGWVAMKASLSTYDDKAVLEECERGEDAAVARYRKALAKPLPENLRQLVERQYQGAQRNHDQVKALRDQFRTQ
jgi:uncharacterized protein (TIGR02284 family)